MSDINELWLTIEELKQNSDPPVDWMEIIESLITRVEDLESSTEHWRKHFHREINTLSENVANFVEIEKSDE